MSPTLRRLRLSPYSCSLWILNRTGAGTAYKQYRIWRAGGWPVGLGEPLVGSEKLIRSHTVLVPTGLAQGPGAVHPARKKKLHNHKTGTCSDCRCLVSALVPHLGRGARHRLRALRCCLALVRPRIKRSIVDVKIPTVPWYLVTQGHTNKQHTN